MVVSPLNVATLLVELSDIDVDLSRRMRIEVRNFESLLL